MTDLPGLAPSRAAHRLTVWLLLMAGLFATATADAAAERDQTEAELQKITRELNSLDAWLGGAARKASQWQKEIQTSDRKVASLSRQVDAAAADLVEVRDRLEGLNRQHEQLQLQRRAQARHVADHLNSAHRMSGEDFIKLLLNQQSPDTFDRMIRYHRYFTEARLSTLQQYRTTLDQLAENQVRLEQEAAEADRRQRALKQEQLALVAQRDERRSLLNRLTSETEDKEAQRSRLLEDRTRLENLLAELKRRSQALDGRAFAASRGSLPWPMTGRVRQAFGQSRAEGRLVWHGLLVAADEGTPVAAVFRGRVVFADWLRGFGLLTIIDHGSGYMTLYGHADALSKQVGDWVESGEVIAQAGRSGGVAEPGLYFEVRHEGRATDPIVWLTKR